MNPFAAQVTALLLVGMAASSSAAGQSSSVKWPGGAQAAVVLSYDDSLRSQLDVAVPQLDRAGFKQVTMHGGYNEEAVSADSAMWVFTAHKS